MVLVTSIYRFYINLPNIANMNTEVNNTAAVQSPSANSLGQLYRLCKRSVIVAYNDEKQPGVYTYELDTKTIYHQNILGVGSNTFYSNSFNIYGYIDSGIVGSVADNVALDRRQVIYQNGKINNHALVTKKPTGGVIVSFVDNNEIKIEMDLWITLQSNNTKKAIRAFYINKSQFNLCDNVTYDSISELVKLTLDEMLALRNHENNLKGVFELTI
ncbi:hypothetical protein E24_00251 [Faustovirus]|nr:hypothetical protein E24_00251 [Faustovirus]AMN85148.1 hypothetical protein E23_00250 [Faustovirus]QBR99144.1 hypothetical protein [Faustovirus mariensis]